VLEEEVLELAALADLEGEVEFAVVLEGVVVFDDAGVLD
jgi:hypothetical protein